MSDVQDYLAGLNQHSAVILKPQFKMAAQIQNEMADCVPCQEYQPPWFLHNVGTEAKGNWYQYRRGITARHWNLVRLVGLPPQVCATDAAPFASVPTAPDMCQTIIGDKDALGSDFWSIGSVEVSPDGRWLAYTVDTQGAERYQLRLKNIDSYAPEAEASCSLHKGSGHHISSHECPTTWKISDNCGPDLQWSQDSESIVATHMTTDTREISQVVKYRLRLQPASAVFQQDPHVIMHIESEASEHTTTLHWMGPCCGGLYLAIRAECLSTSQVRLISLSQAVEQVAQPETTAACVHEHTADELQKVTGLRNSKSRTASSTVPVHGSNSKAATSFRAGDSGNGTTSRMTSSSAEPSLQQEASVSSTGDAAYWVAVPWQDSWDVHQVELVDEVLLALVDTDEYPDGCIVASPAIMLKSTHSITCQDASHQGQRPAKPTVTTGHRHNNMATTSQQHSSVSVSHAEIDSEADNDSHSEIDSEADSDLPAPHHVMLIPGSTTHELRHMEVITSTPNQQTYLAVTRVEALLTHIDVYSISGDTYQSLFALLSGKTTFGCFQHSDIQHKYHQQERRSTSPFLQHCFTHTPVDTYAHVSMKKAEISLSQYEAMYRKVQYDAQAGKMRTGGCTQVEEVPDYTTEAFSREFACDLLWANSYDGVQVPVTVAYKKSAVGMNGSNPCILHVYGAYGSRQDPSFNPLDVALLNRGIIVAVAHVRGGGDQGSTWHKAGKLHDKPNTFADVRAVARDLCERGFTRPHHLAMWGRSAGGLAVAASIAQEPRICRVAVLDVPFLDVLTPMCDPSLPLTWKERKEWGDPMACKSTYDLIKSYSPYHTLEAAVNKAWDEAMQRTLGDGDNDEQSDGVNVPDAWWWPDMYITASLHDDRVPVQIPARYVSALTGIVGRLKAEYESQTSPQAGINRVSQQDNASAHFQACPNAISSSACAERPRPSDMVQNQNRSQRIDLCHPPTAPPPSPTGHHHSRITWPTIVMITDMNSGHSGSSDATSRLEDRADKLAFILSCTQSTRT